MTLQKKLLGLVAIPVVACTTIAVIIASFQLSKQGIQDLEDKSNAILSLNIKNFVEYHQGGGEIEESNVDDIIKGVSNVSAKSGQYKFRISSLSPENPKHKATEKEAGFINGFIKRSENDITYVDKSTNSLWAMRPVYLDEEQGCLACHDGVSTLSGDKKMQGMFMVISDMQTVQDNAQSAIIQISLYGIIVMSLAIVVGIFVIQKIVVVVNEITAVTKKVSEGDLNLKVQISTNDELAELARFINKMVDSLNQILLGVKEAIAELTAATAEISGTSSKISEGAQNQLEKFDILSESVLSTTENTEKASDFVNNSVEHAHDAEEGLENAITALDKIEKHSLRISETINKISDISFQTNLLALNAAIEAARSGIHGKGFAVVASEVKKLSELTNNSVNEIHTVTEGNREDVGSGLQITREAGVRIKEIIEAVPQIAGLLQEILQAVNEQKSIMEDNSTITNLNAGAAEELAVSASSLNDRANSLKEMLSHFNLKE